MTCPRDKVMDVNSLRHGVRESICGQRRRPAGIVSGMAPADHCQGAQKHDLATYVQDVEIQKRRNPNALGRDGISRRLAAQLALCL